ncbi:MAG: sn-glycerol-3-phosphate ABC transporter ATP-binding protein UgpC [Actinobacteria bacterium]|nr:sn-glycerol-3-phosphate ABC transporter ATP-binding protein UgpC [Actinomycetota bacterium]
MADIALESVTRKFPDGTLAVNELNLEIAEGEFVVLVGPSGSGKSTALRMIAGLEEITSGTVKIAGKVVNDLPPRDRDIAMVFQNYALYPHMSVADNMGFALKLRKVPKEDIAKRVKDAAELLGIEDYLQRKPRQLSGGQRQRVAMGRAIVREPAAFLMDEPLSNLDAKLRVQMRTEIAGLHQRLGTTTVYVTHDQVEAVTMADRVAVLRDGMLQQVDTPQRLYDYPVNLFVAGFIGSPAMNMVPARVTSKDSGAVVVFGSHEIKIPAKRLQASKLEEFKDKEVILGIRPEDFEDPDLIPERQEENLLEVKVSLSETLGSETIIYFDVDAPAVLTKDTMDLSSDASVEEAAASEPRNESTFTARLNPKTKARGGEAARLAVDASRLYFFDPTTGRVIG